MTRPPSGGLQVATCNAAKLRHFVVFTALHLCRTVLAMSELSVRLSDAKPKKFLS